MDSNLDELFDARNYFFLGSYQNCVRSLQSVKPKSSEVQLEKDIITYRTFIAQKKYSVIFDEIRKDANAELKSVRLLAEYLSDSSDKNHENVVSQLDGLISSNLDVKNYITLLMAANIYLLEDKYDLALKVLHNSDAMECIFLTVQILLQIHRIDLAKKELKRLMDINEDHTLSQLALALCDLSVGGEKLTEALQIYQELAEKYQVSVLLLNGQAAALISMNRWEEAEALLQVANDKDPNNAETLINMIVVAGHLGKSSEIINRYISQLKESHRYHPFVVDYLAKESEFNRLAQSYCASVA